MTTKAITLVTGNPGKLRELQALAKDKLNIVAHSLDLVEIQSMDPKEIVNDKLRRAYEVIKGPVIVEDVSAGIDELKGLPGPFYKFFREILDDEVLLRISSGPGSKVTICCIAGYFDGKTMLFGEGVLKGTLAERRGSNGFGFDPFIVPEGETRTMAEMTPEEKNAISHRGKAFHSLLDQIK